MPSWCNSMPEVAGTEVTTWVPSDKKTRTECQAFRERVLGDASREEAFDRIEEGLSTDVLDNLLAVVPAATRSVAGVLKISPRTLARRRREGRPNSVESDRLFRLLELYAHAADVFEGIEAADEWMRSPALALGDHTPLEYSVNEVGAKRVDNLLGRIEHGVYS